MSIEERKKLIAQRMREGGLKDFAYNPDAPIYNEKSDNIINDIQTPEQINSNSMSEPQNQNGNNSNLGHINPINPKSKNKYNLVEEYFQICDRKGENPLSGPELKKMKMKDLEELVKKINKKPDVITAGPKQERKFQNAGQNFYNFHRSFAAVSEAGINRTGKYEVEGLKKNVEENENLLKEIGEELFQDDDSAFIMEYLGSPYVKLLTVYGIIGMNTNIKKKVQPMTAAQISQEKSEKEIEEEMF